MEYFIADSHFGHKWIAENRKFSSLIEMETTLINNWNSIITDNDTVYVLGDFAYKTSSSKIRKIFTLLKGKIIFIPGNHDGKTLLANKQQQRFELVDKIHEVELYGFNFVLCHFPLYSWKHKEKGSIHIHGHTHDNEIEFKHPRLKCVSCELTDYKPKSVLDILKDLGLSIPETTKIDFDDN